MPKLPYLSNPLPSARINSTYGGSSWDGRTLESLKGYFSNEGCKERIFILGNGPSLLQLTQAEREALEGEYLFASGRYVWWKEHILPSFYFIGEAKHTEQWQQMGLGHPDVIFFRFWVNWQPPPPGWIIVPRPGSEGTTVTNSGFQGFGQTYPEHHRGRDAPLDMFQIAAWLGFRKMYLLGVDNTMQGHVWNIEEDRTTGQARPDLVAPLYRQANELLDGQLIDCTPGGRLPQMAGLSFLPLQEVLKDAL